MSTQMTSRKLLFGTDRFVSGYMEDIPTLALIRNMKLPMETEYTLLRRNAERTLDL